MTPEREAEIRSIPPRDDSTTGAPAQQTVATRAILDLLESIDELRRASVGLDSQLRDAESELAMLREVTLRYKRSRSPAYKCGPEHNADLDRDTCVACVTEIMDAESTMAWAIGDMCAAAKAHDARVHAEGMCDAADECDRIADAHSVERRDHIALAEAAVTDSDEQREEYEYARSLSAQRHTLRLTAGTIRAVASSRTHESGMVLAAKTIDRAAVDPECARLVGRLVDVCTVGGGPEDHALMVACNDLKTYIKAHGR